VVEILSPRTAFLDKKIKRRVYTRTGVKELWLIDPDIKTIQVFFMQKNPETPAATYSEKDTFSSPQFPGLKFKGSEIFAS
jgi:Uma2 family endonuclease